MGFPVHIKAGMSRVSIAKEIAEVSRLRLQFERNLGFQMYSIFAKVAEDAAREYRASGDVYKSLIGIDGRIEAAIRAHQSAVIERFAARAFDNRKADKFTSLVFQYYNDDQAQKVTNISSVTRLNIANAIRAGERDAMGVDKTAKLIVERTAGAIGRARAATIARTETHAAASYATHEATKEMDLPAARKRWVAVGDARTRGHHAAANGQEVGMDEKFIIRYKGQEIEMMHPHDGSGGAGNNINCRCLALYYSDIDAIFDDEPTEPVQPAPVDVTPPETPSQPVARPQTTDDPLGPDARFVSPRDKALTVATLPIRKKAEVMRELGASVKAASDDPNNADVWSFAGRWRGQTEKDFGRAGISSFSLKSATAVNVVNNELNYLADFIGVPRLRGIKAAKSKRINGSMGGGVMQLSNKAVGIYIEQGTLRKVDEIKKDLDAARDDYYQARNELRDIARLGPRIDDPAYVAAKERQTSATLKYNALVDEHSLSSEAASRGAGDLATYRLGDEISERPWSTKEYFSDGVDKLRMLMYHEFGHHVHQTYKLTSGYDRGQNYIESKLGDFWRGTKKGELEQFAPSTYAMSNQYEYFVESFAMYMFGRTDMMHPKILELIEEILNERGK